VPRVSIVLPNYNYARYLDERVQGLLDQSYRDFELVIVDDASTDESLEVLEQYRHDTRVRVHTRAENSGRVYASWNEGLKLCAGELVLFAGADDAAEREMLERLVACFDQHPSIVLAHCAFMTIDEIGHINATRIPLPPQADFIVDSLANDYVAAPGEEWLRLLVTNFIWNASGVLMRTDAVRANGGFDAEMLIASDWLLYQQLTRTGGAAYVSHPLNSFRQLRKSVSRRLQGARLVGELYECLSRQTQFVDVQSRPFLDLGLAFADRAFAGYVESNRSAGNHDEVQKLTDVHARYRPGSPSA
jgi:glycosyltransferase involved in cell wall biosynthesis